MSTVSEGRHRPQPIQTSGAAIPSPEGFLEIENAAWSASPCSPLSRPFPVHPESSEKLEKANRMKEHDNETVGRLQPRSRRSSPNTEPSLRKASLASISELALPLPRKALLNGRSPLSAPLFPPAEFQGQTIVEETRNMLLHEPGANRGVPPQLSERRQSAPPGPVLARHIQLQRHRDHINRRVLGGLHYPREPDLLVIPVDYRRISAITPSDIDAKHLTPFPQDGHVTIRILIHSRGRKPMALTRNFDLDKLRATIPDQRAMVNTRFPTRLASPTWGSRRASVASLQTPITTSRPTSPGFVEERRHSSAAINLESPGRTPRTDRRVLRREVSPVPMHLEYARLHLPVLAAIILSEMVHHGDIIELALPHPRAWKDTVTYIYSGDVALTELIRQNILYLGGKV